MIEKLSARTVATKSKTGIYGDGGGLYLKVTPTGTRSWIFRYRQGKTCHALGLGSCNDLTLAEARERAREQRRLRLDGHDPATMKRAKVAERRAADAKAMTFEDCAKAYIMAHQSAWRSATEGREWSGKLRDYAYPVIGKLPVGMVDLPLVLRIVEPLWSTKTSTANKVRRYVESILAWATVRGYRVGDNPARWRGHLDQLLPKVSKVAPVEHHAALPYSDINALMVELAAIGSRGARAAEFLVLTATRASEAIGATWQEIDFKGYTWTIPAGRMKTAVEHRVPLSDAALALLQALPRTGPRIFPMVRQTPLYVLQRLRPEITLHGLRSTFRDWAGERTSFAREVVEQCLAHAAGDQTELAYRRGDALEKRRHVMDAWAKFCAQPALAGEVVPLHHRA